MSKQYWLCCGSLCPEHKDSRGQKCREAATGHPERCRFGTSEDHGKWDRAQKESAYVSIDRDKLKRLQADSEELANLLAAQQQAEPVMQVSPEVSKQISKRGRDAIMAAERLITLDESKTVSLEDMESRFGVEPATPSEDGGEVPESTTGVQAYMAIRAYADAIYRKVDKAASDYEKGVSALGYMEDIAGTALVIRNHMDDLLAELRTRPTRKVGGDDDHLHGHPRYEHDSRDEIELFLRDAYAAGANAAHSRSLTTALDYAARHAPKLRAALAPAAVVMPERKTRDPIDWDECSREMATDDAQFCGFNAALDEVARLNSRAIPEGLLEKAADLLKSYQQVIDGCHSSEIERFDYQPEVQGTAAELRALLGKEGE